MPKALIVGLCLVGLGGLLALLRAEATARVLIGAGAAVGTIGAGWALWRGGSEPLILSSKLGGQPISLSYAPEALWLMAFGLLPAAFAVFIATPKRSMRSGWLLGAALSLTGAWGVFGSQDGYVLLISWELMSLGAGAMLLSERQGREAGVNVLFMLALLEVGVVALLIAILLLSRAGGGGHGRRRFAGWRHGFVGWNEWPGGGASCGGIRREARITTILRMAPARIRRRQRCFRRIDVGHCAECRFFRAFPRSGAMAAGRDLRLVLAGCRHRNCRCVVGDSGGAIRLSVG